ncbi:hypothetical protein VNI00_003686 [Paramarasmius palmivorus]|uniref:Uncharacterized protein n=1 Tax=Paramarasmius palmivorus TaxID=297713 RepID=A0AAW0DVE6_9AGAR
MSDLDDLKISNLVNLTGRIALITGGGTGIGLMIAKGFAANGVKVYITGRREEVLHQVHLQYPNIQPLRMDVTNKEEIANAVKVIEEEDGKLDILVNKYISSLSYTLLAKEYPDSAGDVGPFYSLSESAGGVMNSMPYALAQDKDCDQWSNSHFFNQYDFEHWANVFNLNTTAPFFVTMAFLDLLKKGAASRKVMSSVIMISSVAGGKAKITYNIVGFISIA